MRATGTTTVITNGTALSQCPSLEVQRTHYSALIVHVIQGGHAEEQWIIRIHGGANETQEGHPKGPWGGVWCVVPGSYVVAVLNQSELRLAGAPEAAVLASTTVTIGVQQELEVTLEIPEAEPAGVG